MRYLFFVMASIVLLASVWIALTHGQVLGPEGSMNSPVRNIIYVHVPSSICALLCFIVLVIASIGYLSTSKDAWDRLAIAAAEVGTVFAIILNVTGSIFSRAEWNTWWTAASPRYVVYLILRSSLSGSRQKIGRICAVFSLIAFLDVPMVILSARFIPDPMHRRSFEFGSSWQRAAFFLGMISISLLAAYFIWLRTSVLKNKDMLERDLIS
ncbi:MAG: cytochrome c biogenesis protein CcsA [Planctomycetota bacterium]|jgi:ABC-type transport system involved in cytochrome c biogenesis permease subunit